MLGNVKNLSLKGMFVIEVFRRLMCTVYGLEQPPAKYVELISRRKSEGYNVDEVFDSNGCN